MHTNVLNRYVFMIVDESVVNSENVHCYTNCDTSSPSNNVLQDFIDMSIGNLNVCCSNGGVTTGYGTDTSSCTLCKLCCVYNA